MSNEAAPLAHVLMVPTCLVDLFRPQIGVATVELLDRAGCRVSVSATITCCGQPAYNSGDRRLARRLAQAVIAECERHDHVVLPSGSCAGMLRVHYPKLFADNAAWRERAERVAAKTHELTAFLVDVRQVRQIEGRYARRVAYHDSCSGLRELGIHGQPRRLIDSLQGLSRAEVGNAQVCCGFGGLFCMKFPEISARMAQERCAAVAASGAEVLLGGDLGCLMNLAGTFARSGSAIEVRHVVEVLAGRTASPALCGQPQATA